jgi:hypothetical protein
MVFRVIMIAVYFEDYVEKAIPAVEILNMTGCCNQVYTYNKT